MPSMKDDQFPRNLTKGKIAETIFWLMFRDTHFTILPYGYEHVLPLIAQNYRPESPANNNVNKMRATPDFILIAPNKSVFTIDVKYCHDLKRNRLKSKAKKTLEEWEDCYYFIATPEGFYLNSCKDITAGLDFTPLSSNLVSDSVQNYFTDLLNEFIHVENKTSRNYSEEELTQPSNIIFDINDITTKTDSTILERAGRAWDDAEDKGLIEEFDTGENLKAIAKKHKRSYGAIRSRLVKLGKIERKVN